MTLTGRDRADILSLLSSLGDPDSLARASDLTSTSKEAAEYLRQMQAIAAALNLPEDTSSPLTTDQVLEIRDKVMHRRGKERPGLWRAGWGSRLLTRKYAAIAAAVLLFLGPGLWFLHRGWGQQVIAQALLTPSGGITQPGAPGGPPGSAISSRFPVLPGTALETGEQWGGIALLSGNRVTVDRASKVNIVSDDEVRLVAGSCFIRAVRPMRVLALSAQLEIIQGAVYVHVFGDRVACEVFSGGATVKTAGKTSQIWSGTAWKWHSTRNMSTEGPLENKPPAMVERVDSLWRREGLSR